MSLINCYSNWKDGVSPEYLFKESKRRIEEKKKLIDDLNNEYELLMNQAFNQYKKFVEYYHLPIEIIKGARDWLSMNKSGKDKWGNKLDRRKSYKEKYNFEYLDSSLKEYLKLDDFEMKEIIDYNYGQYYEVVFTSHNHKWYICIPNIDEIDIRKFESMKDDTFKLSLHHYDEEHITSAFGYTFNEEELSDIMKKGVEKYCS